MIAQKLKHLKMERGLTNADLAEQTGIPLPTINRLVSGQTTNPTWDVMLSISDALDVPLDEFSGHQSLRIIREPERNHMRKYRVLNSAGRREVDEYLEQVHEKWVSQIIRNEDLFSHRAVIDKIYNLDLFKLEKLLAYMEEL